MNNKRGIKISFEGMTLKQRLSVWWTFTKACLLKKDLKTKYKVTEIVFNSRTD